MFAFPVGSPLAANLMEKIQSRAARVAILGLGYVGLPLAAQAARKGYTVVGFDIDEGKSVRINAGQSYIEAVSDADVAAFVVAGKLRATAKFDEISACDVIILCVPTPL